MSNEIPEEINRVVKKRSEIINTSFLDRHRKSYGALSMMDIDCMYFKYDKPCLMLELKYGSTPNIDLADKQFKRLLNVANPLNIPAFCVLYYFPGTNEYNNKVDEFGPYRNFYLIPLNNSARSYLFNAEPMILTEKQFVELIYKIKGQPITPNLQLDSILNPNLPIPRIFSKDIGISKWNNQINEWETRIYA